ATVIGAAIHLGRCLNLMSRHAYDAIAHSYKALECKFQTAGIPLPNNGRTGMRRNLDCAVIQHVHQMRANAVPTPLRPYDTVRGLFIEGAEAFPGSMLRRNTHVQICVRETRVIKGYFRVSKSIFGTRRPERHRRRSSRRGGRRGGGPRARTDMPIPLTAVTRPVTIRFSRWIWLGGRSFVTC
ncbi:MAG: hypothetical protein HQL38_13900, partial [Alphaproteobacteria bacterium]|nr:hypothetical protein [Alphaproteobacteria bacterium]